MKSSAGTEELQASFRLIGLGLVRAESLYFWFGNLGRLCIEPVDQPSVYDFLRQEFVGIKTGDLELYLEDVRELRKEEEPFPEYLAIPPPSGELPLVARFLSYFWFSERRRKMFEEALDREIRRRHGESDDGDTPIPAGYPLRVSFRS